jgi:glutathione S-transferase
MRQVGFAGLSLDEYPTLKGWVERLQGLSEVVRAYESVKAGEEAK